MSDEVSTSDAPEGEGDNQKLETHRPLVREIDKRFATIYGFGGAAVLAAASVPIIVAYALGFLGYVATYVIAITVGLVALFVLRAVVAGQRERLRERVESYCELNDLSPTALRDYYAGEDVYPYFQALFEGPSAIEGAASERTE